MPIRRIVIAVRLSTMDPHVMKLLKMASILAMLIISIILHGGEVKTRLHLLKKRKQNRFEGNLMSERLFEGLL